MMILGKRIYQGFCVYSVSNMRKMKAFYKVGYRAYNEVHYYVMN
jgi:hypothetical protein